MQFLVLTDEKDNRAIPFSRIREIDLNIRGASFNGMVRIELLEPSSFTGNWFCLSGKSAEKVRAFFESGASDSILRVSWGDIEE